MRRAIVPLMLVACGGSAPGMQAPPSPSPTPSPLPIATQGRRLVAGAELRIFGVAGDQVVYGANDASGPVATVALAGGAPKTLLPKGTATVSASTIFACDGDGAGLVLNARGRRALDHVTCIPGGVASPDGRSFVYDKGYDPSARELRLATIDGSLDAPLVHADQVAFAGGQFILTSGWTLHAVDPATATLRTLVTDLDRNFADLDLASGNVAYLSTGGQLSLLTPAGAVTPIEAGVAQARFNRDGSAIYYVTKQGAIRRWTSGGAPVPLVDGNAETDHLNAYWVPNLSPDEKWMAFPDNKWWEGRIVPTGQHATLGTPIPGFIGGGDFTSDSSFYLYFNDCDHQCSTIYARAVPDGAPFLVATHVHTTQSLVGGRVLVDAQSDAHGSRLSIGVPGGAFSPIADGVDNWLTAVEEKGRERIEHVVYAADDGLYVDVVSGR